MMSQIEQTFAAAARTPKGRRARQAIFRATRETIARFGLQDTSLDEIASRAGMTQAALRHHFHTRDELVSAFFVAASEWFRARIDAILADTTLHSRQRLEHCIGWHLEYMEDVDTVLWFEASAYWLRATPPRRVRDDWYRWLAGQYAALIGHLQPTLGRRERERRAFTVLTLVLGAWVTHGRGSTLATAGTAVERRQLLVDAAMEIALH